MRNKLLLAIIILTATVFRFNGLNWDANFHLHPDERFLTMVGNAMTLPTSIAQYLDPATSPMNPANHEYMFYVYGVLPIVLNKILAVWGNTDTYNAFTLQGRALSAIFDLGTLIFVYKIGNLLDTSRQKLLGLVASFLYAVAVLPIQLSHYFAVDTFLNFFMIGASFFALRQYKEPHRKNIILSGLFFGLAVACKINAVLILPLLMAFIFWNSVSNLKDKAGRTARWLPHNTGVLLLFIICSYSILRISAPYYFETGNVFDFHLSKTFVSSVQSLKSFEGKDVWYPPAVQWIQKPPVTFSLINLALLGVGIPYFVCILLGLLLPLLWKKNEEILKLPYIFMLCWVLGFFLYQSTQFVKAMRYFIFIYPFLAVIAGYGLISLIRHIGGKKKYVLYAPILLVILVWPLAFSSVYIHKHSRVTASEWIYKNLPNNALILTEHWDDGLPLPMEMNYGKQFVGEQLPVFDPDTSTKWETINTQLMKGDYYILTSNRGWGSIPTVPEKYPLMTVFYQELFAGKTMYRKIAEFTSYPSLRYLGIPFEVPTDWVDESFTVYDHPVVMIYQRQK